MAVVLVACAVVVYGLNTVAHWAPPQVGREIDFARDFSVPRRVDTALREKLANAYPTIPAIPRSFEQVTQQIAPAIVLIDTGEGEGTGTVIHTDGLLLTNAHVVEGASRLLACFQGGQPVQLSVLAVDPAADVALLRAPAAGLSAVALGDSSTVRVGEEIAVGGYALGTVMEERLGIMGRSPSFAKGIVSALRQEKGHDVIQFDAKITAGYSGGPLFRAGTGEVVGLATSEIIGLLSGSTGVSFAIGINSAKALWSPELMLPNQRGTSGVGP